MIVSAAFGLSVEKFLTFAFQKITVTMPDGTVMVTPKREYFDIYHLVKKGSALELKLYPDLACSGIRGYSSSFDVPAGDLDRLDDIIRRTKICVLDTNYEIIPDSNDGDCKVIAFPDPTVTPGAIAMMTALGEEWATEHRLDKVIFASTIAVY